MRFFLIASFLLCVSFYTQAQDQAYLFVNTTNVCVSGSVNFTVLPEMPGYAYHLYRIEREDEKEVERYVRQSDNNFFSVTFTNAEVIRYKVKVIEKKESPKTITSNEVHIEVNELPKPIALKEGLGDVSVSSDNAPIALIGLCNIPAGTTVEFSGEGVYDGKFHPVAFPDGDKVRPLVKVRNAKGCEATYAFPCEFTITPIIRPLPSFIGRDNPPPYCENKGEQVLDIVLGDKDILEEVYFFYDDQKEVLEFEYQKKLKKYFITIDPTKHNNYVITLYIKYKINDGKDEKDDKGDIAILPAFRPQLKGISYINTSSSSEESIVYVRACASGIDDEFVLQVDRPHNTGYGISFSRMNNTHIEEGGMLPIKPVGDDNQSYYSYTINKNALFEREFGRHQDDKLIVKISQSGNRCGTNEEMTFVISFEYFHENKPKIELSEPPYCAGTPINMKLIKKNVSNSLLYLLEHYEVKFGTEESYKGRADAISYIYSTAGLYKLNFKAENVLGFNLYTCPADTFITFEVGASPQSRFNVENNIFDLNSIFTNTSELSNFSTEPSYAKEDIITKAIWSFGDGSDDEELVYIKDETKEHLYSLNSLGERPFVVALIVETSKGCLDTITNDIPIFKLYDFKEESFYFNDFDTEKVYEFNQSGYYRQNSKSITSSWKDTPLLWNNVSSLYNTSWVTHNKDTSYNPNEISWVESPAFILDNLERPMVRMNTWVSAESQVDGVNFQYCIMDASFGNETWKTLGEVRKGLNWYNSSIIVTKSLGEAKFDQGWTGTGATDWQLSAYALDNVKEEAKGLPVRFRFSFTSNNENPPGKYNGFAFDNFFIGERNRVVLLENFQNTSTYNKEEIQEWQSDNQTAIISYYVGHLQKDSINEQNKADPSARALHYGVHKLPRLAIDGVSPQTVGMAWASDSIQKRKLTTSEFDITSLGLQVDADTRELVFKGKLYRNVSTELARPVLIQVAVVEDEVNVNGNTYTNVLRKLLPNAAGKRIASWPEEHFEEIEYRWQPFVAPYSGYKVVVFIQDEQSKEIYQAGAWALSEADAQLLDVKTTKQVSTSFRMPVYDEIILYPNPTNTEDVQVLFNGILEDDCIWELKDRLGIVHARGTVSKGVNLASLKLPNVASGIYQVNFIGKEYRQSAKLSIIK